MSVECRPIVTRVSADSRPSIGRDIGQVSADTAGRYSTDTRVSANSCRQLSGDRCRQMSVECRPIVARVSADTRPSRVLADSVGQCSTDT